MPKEKDGGPSDPTTKARNEVEKVLAERYGVSRLEARNLHAGVVNAIKHELVGGRAVHLGAIGVITPVKNQSGPLEGPMHLSGGLNLGPWSQDADTRASRRKTTRLQTTLHFEPSQGFKKSMESKRKRNFSKSMRDQKLYHKDDETVSFTEALNAAPVAAISSEASLVDTLRARMNMTRVGAQDLVQVVQALWMSNLITNQSLEIEGCGRFRIEKAPGGKHWDEVWDEVVDAPDKDVATFQANKGFKAELSRAQAHTKHEILCRHVEAHGPAEPGKESLSIGKQMMVGIQRSTRKARSPSAKEVNEEAARKMGLPKP
ncbi:MULTISPECIES: hypothetical protein [unclassified Thioalkalivibrio]|uniref:hypothetical protein n=1 Tax=unclassified Thioalkalivibrio TaxID=2621013 RepID=UPI00036ADB1B|nr:MULTISPECIES: hypothetical protein [unclassified Thioalkalivibrio]